MTNPWSDRLARLAPAAVGAVAALLAACADTQTSEGLLSRLTPYKVEVVQGNVVTREMLQGLRPGLTREQVRGLLGSPLLTDPFHADRWDYVFAIRREGTVPQQRKVSVFFASDRVERFDADELPAERDFVQSIDPDKSAGARPRVLELTEDQLKKLPVPPKVAAAEAPASGPLRSYPPLEGTPK